MADEKRWTAAQSAAIGERSRTLLLSAAAGSGKTATLTERVIRSITDPESPTDITRMLVVTFTNAAAGELRDRISAAITKEIKASPGNARLARQLLLLPDADICTIDGFCRKLLREHADDAGLAPDFRIGDENEIAVIKRAVMEGLVNRAYDGEESFATEEEFCAFADHLVSARNEAELIEILIRLHEKTDGFPDGVAFYTRYAEYVDTFVGKSPDETPWGERLRRSAAELAAEYRLSISQAIDALPDDPAVKAKYGGAAEWDIAYLDRLALAAESGYDAIRECLADFRPRSVSSKRLDEIPEEATVYVALRDRFKQKVKEELSRRFLYTGEEWAPFLAAFAHETRLLASLLTQFDALFTSEKRRRGLVSFSDLEHLTLSLLSENGKPTPLAREIGAGYDAIYIDEYQDINSVQHLIFESIATERNRFMVGDIKQSIYGFRLAEPAIFAGMRQSFPPYDPSDGAPNASIFMSENFRCDKTVVDFVNAVFDRLLGVAGESIGYRADDRLKFSKITPEGADPVRAVLAVFGRERGEEDRKADEDEITSDEQPEPAWVAAEIGRLLREERLADGKPIRPRDVAILLRSTSTRARVYRDALTALGIPAISEEKDRFFVNAEVLLALCLLNVIDNPHRDIHLAGLLCSPLFRFTPEELAEIRREAPPSIPLYDALLAYNGAHPSFEKGISFVERLERMRECAEGMPVDRLMLRLFAETGLLSIGGADGKDGKQNLLLLYHFAKTFTASSFKGLYRFIEYLNEIVRSKRSFRSPSDAGADADAVRIMTIHGSKGLEFPVCFVSDCGRSLRPRDLRETWLFDSSLGFAMMLRDETGYAKVSNPIYRAVGDAISESAAEEELRLLYVALTRARERLYVTGAASKRTYLDSYLERCKLNRRTLTAATVKGASSYLEWLLSTVGDEPSEIADVLINPAFPSSEKSELPSPQAAEEAGVSGESGADADMAALLRERFSYSYPHRHIGILPRKLSVSRLSPRVLDGADESDLVLFSEEGGEETAADAPLPRFYGGEDPRLAAKRGTATHEFLQFCDLSLLAKHGPEPELERLIAERFLPETAREMVRLDELRRLAASDFLRELISAKTVRRELRFNSMLPASLFTEDKALRESLSDKTVLVQGVIDCIYETEDGRLILVDYKTDRLDRRDREAARRQLRERHRAQLGYYALAVEQMFGRRPDEILLYSLCLGEAVSL